MILTRISVKNTLLERIRPHFSSQFLYSGSPFIIRAKEEGKPVFYQVNDIKSIIHANPAQYSCKHPI